MSLRREFPPPEIAEVNPESPEAEQEGWSYTASLRWRQSLLSATLVAFSVGIITVAAYWTVSESLTSSVDSELENKAQAMLSRAYTFDSVPEIDSEIAALKAYNPDIRVAVAPAGWEYVVGDSIALPGDFFIDFSYPGVNSLSVAGDRVLVMHDETGAAVLVAKDMSETRRLLTSLGVALLVISGIGVLASILVGFSISNLGLKPLVRLQQAVERLARTDELEPIRIDGNDEIARLSNSFNELIEALRVARLRQAQLVADAGHELKTPLTSMRTNIELLILSSKSDAQSITDQDREDLEHDLIAQLEELSTLVGDLMDLAREESSNTLEQVNLDEILTGAIERAQRRRHDVRIELQQSTEWYLLGDEFSLGRALVNVLDNAVKWSPEDGTVRVRMQQQSESEVWLTVSDSGPGIPEEERSRVFDRFYRSVSSRSMPGSGLGLAIVWQVIEHSGGVVGVSDSDDGGTMITIILPGFADREHLGTIGA
ncbi:sensor histidine kinase [Corynebacterium pacaense]|uniref:sensor histidine kinase n=1 Tax=Corynebacterium pacaense TaxID=1816684 RepID=UPI0009BA7343|nr:HAMP domain-containing sensor histidine kinase [Corynebacterium pacaense]